MILTLNMKDIMLGVLSPRGGGGDWIAADETRLYLRDGFISYKHTHTHIHTDTHEYMHECVCVCVIRKYRHMRKNIWDVARCDL